MIRMIENSSSAPPGTTTLMTTLSGYTKGIIISESHAAPNNFKKGTEREVSADLIFKNGLYYDIFQRSSWLLSRPKVLVMLLTQILILMMEISMINNSFKKHSFVYSVLVTSLQTDKGRELVKEYEGNAITNF